MTVAIDPQHVHFQRITVAAVLVVSRTYGKAEAKIRARKITADWFWVSSKELGEAWLKQCSEKGINIEADWIYC